MIFGMWNPEKICDQKVLDLPTSPVSCSHFTLENPKKSRFSTILFIRTSDYLHYLKIKRTVTITVNLPTTPENCNCTVLQKTELVNLTEGVLFSAKCGWLWKEPIVLYGTLNVTSQQMFKVTTSSSPLSICIIHHALLKFCPCLAVDATRPYHESTLDARAPASCPKCSSVPSLGQDGWLDMSGPMNWGVSPCRSSPVSRSRWDNLNNEKYAWTVLLKNDFLDFPR